MRLIFETEYPRQVLPGEAMEVFAELVHNAASSALRVESHFESNQPLFSPNATASGGTVFGAALVKHAKEFELAAIPRGKKENECRQHAKRFQRIFDHCLHREGFRLLAIVPMPPTGVWCSREINSTKGLVGLRVRSYDALSREVFSSIGCEASHLPFSQLRAALEAKAFDAVVSSGDGAAGDLLADHFGHYLPVAHSTPFCLDFRWRASIMSSAE